jgi:hypothetical protein
MDFGRIVETLDVIIEPKNCGPFFAGIITAHSLEDTGTIMKNMSVYVNRCIQPIDHLTVIPDFGIFVEATHLCPPSSLLFANLALNLTNLSRRNKDIQNILTVHEPFIQA